MPPCQDRLPLDSYLGAELTPHTVFSVFACWESEEYAQRNVSSMRILFGLKKGKKYW